MNRFWLYRQTLQHCQPEGAVQDGERSCRVHCFCFDKMTVAIASFTFLLAAVCAALMGFAIQRGATCTVAAVGEVVQKGTTRKIGALAETSLWVAGGLLTARALGFLPNVPSGFALSHWTFVGAALLGVGAYVNQACVFGSVARLGSGQWAFALTPLGFYLGAVTAPLVFSEMMAVPLQTLSTRSALPFWLAPIFGAYALWRIVRIGQNARSGGSGLGRLWAPHEATILIGITFVITLVAVGAWGYMDLLIHIAHGMPDNFPWQGTMFLALLAGAILGGWVGGSLAWHRQSPITMIRCLVGGLLMGWGSLLVPGSNDGLILVGMPLLWPYAWLSIVTMCAVIWVAFKVEDKFAQR
jgi:toxin CptA